MADMLDDAQVHMPTEDEVRELFEQVGLGNMEQAETELLPPPPDFLLNPPSHGQSLFETRTSNVSIWDVKAQSRYA